MRDELIALARQQVGTTELPAGSNNVKYNTWFYGHEVHDGDKPGAHYPWCCTFLCWLFAQIGKPMPKADYLRGWSSVPNLYLYAIKHGMITNEPKAGDLVIYEWGGQIRHIGMFIEKVDKYTIHTVEGNTSSDMKGSQDNGGCCALKHQNIRIVKAYINIDSFIK